jgi:hypothetical protein
MKVQYKGFEVMARREVSVTGDKGDTPLRYYVLRISDGYDVVSGFSYGKDTVRTFVGFLKGTVDDFLEDPQAYYTRDGVVYDEETEPEEIDEDAEPLEDEDNL